MIQPPGHDPAARRAFILANTRPLIVPHAPELRLHLADEATELWRRTEEELGAIGLPPPFWAFAWAGGQALARWVLDNPGAVAGKAVLDFASGSGLVAIAAARAGALAVEAADIDAYAIAAMQINAALNGVAISPLPENQIGRDAGWDTVLAGDICYERDLAGRVADWLASLARRGARVLIGDPGRSYLPRERLTLIATYEVPVTRELEDAEIKKSSVWRLEG
ncbi:MAG: methyltransferase [Bosea sp.]|jgi:predicted nicotinamide N-methyase|nr:methyltransferase [Bosea sp. (in: a-proteobacteria)]